MPDNPQPAEHRLTLRGSRPVVPIRRVDRPYLSRRHRPSMEAPRVDSVRGLPLSAVRRPQFQRQWGANTMRLSRHKGVLALFAIGLLSLSVAACGDDNNASDTSTTSGQAKGEFEFFSWWTGGGDSEGKQALLDLFQEQNPDVKIIDSASRAVRARTPRPSSRTVCSPTTRPTRTSGTPARSCSTTSTRARSRTSAPYTTTETGATSSRSVCSTSSPSTASCTPSP